MSVICPAAGSDLLNPSIELLCNLAVLEPAPESGGNNGATEEKPFSPTASGTLYSMQAITTGTLAFSRKAAKIVVALGGSSAILAAVKAIWFTSTTAETAAVIGGASVILAAAFLSLAIIVRSDLLTRSTAQAAEYEARRQIASTFLQTPERVQGASASQIYWLRRNGARAWQAVDHFEVGANGFVAVLADQNKTEVVPGDIDIVVKASVVR